MVKRAALVPLAATVLLAAGCGSSSKPTSNLPSALRPYVPYLEKYDHLHMRSLPGSMTVRVGRRQAETVARARGIPGVSASLVRGTLGGYCRLEHGTCRLLVRDRALWIGLVPGQSVSPQGPGKSPYGGTMAVLVDANSGRYIMAAAIPDEDLTSAVTLGR